MSLQLITGYSFVNGEKNVTHTKLNLQVNGATCVAGTISAADLADGLITKAKLDSSVAGLGLELNGVDNSLQVIGTGFTSTGLTNANQTLTRSTSTKSQKYTGALSGPVIINLSRSTAVAGDMFRIILSDVTVDATNTLTIRENGAGSLAVFNDATTPHVRGLIECEFNGTSWEITNANTNESAS